MESLHTWLLAGQGAESWRSAISLAARPDPALWGSKAPSQYTTFQTHARMRKRRVHWCRPGCKRWLPTNQACALDKQGPLTKLRFLHLKTLTEVIETPTDSTESTR